MSSIGLTYFSSKGSTEEMAKAVEKGLQSGSADFYFSKIKELDKDKFFKNDILIMGSPASGSEEINANFFMPLMSDYGDKFKGKKVFLFGSYGWGGGEYMKKWEKELKELGAEILFDYVVYPNVPDKPVLDQLTIIGEKISKL